LFEGEVDLLVESDDRSGELVSLDGAGAAQLRLGVLLCLAVEGNR
jgi:hypothetical protein